MTDQLDDLKRALKAAKPAANADKKAAAIALARKNFDAAQELADAPRPIHKQTQKASAFWTGAFNMIDKLTSRPALYATSFLCITGLTLIVTKDMLQETTDTAGIPKDQSALNEQADGAGWMGTDTDLQATARPSTKTRTDKQTTVTKPKPVVKSKNQVVQRPDTDGTVPLKKPVPMPKKAIRKRDAAKIVTGNLRRSTTPSSGTTAPHSSAETLLPRAEVVPQLNTPNVAAKTVQPLPDDTAAMEFPDRETFAEKPKTAIKTVVDEPVSTFSIDVDTAAYSYVRASIQNGQLPNARAVRVEEMVNYFPYDYPAPDLSDAPFSTSVNVFQTPWNADTKLLHIGIQGAKPAIDDRPPLNLVFLIDTSGSMHRRNKLPLLKQSFRLLLGTLRPTDKVAIVTYAGSAGMALPPTEASNKSTILASLDNLRAGGSTAGQAGLQQAYSLAESMRSEGSVERVLLATDGDFNVGINDPDVLKSFVEKKRDTGVYLSVFGFGRGNYRDDMMQSLAQNGNGTAAYIDTLAEAQKVLVDQVSGALFPIANDVKIQIEFNPTQIAEYRLIGYETRALKREDFNNDKIDAGEIGAGHTVTAIYEITPVGSPAIRISPLRYGAQKVEADYADTPEFGFLKLRYKDPGQSKSKLIATPIASDTGAPNTEAKFAAAIAGFGQLLSDDNYLGDWGWDGAIDLALEGKGSDEFGYRAEAIQMMRLAKSIDN